MSHTDRGWLFNARETCRYLPGTFDHLCYFDSLDWPASEQSVFRKAPSDQNRLEMLLQKIIGSDVVTTNQGLSQSDSHNHNNNHTMRLLTHKDMLMSNGNLLALPCLSKLGLCQRFGFLTTPCSSLRFSATLAAGAFWFHLGLCCRRDIAVCSTCGTYRL
jgi:hypothetical protein